MPSDYEKLTDRHRDALVAERIMGWRNVMYYPQSDQCSGEPAGVVGQIEIPFYSTDDNAARLVRDRIAELGLELKFALFLESSIELNNIHRLVFNYMQTTPRQQGIAALQSLDTRKTEGDRT